MAQRWVWVENPAYAGKQPRRAKAGTACHDGTHFITISCSCGFDMHLHESQLTGMSENAYVVMLCKGCGEVLEFGRGWFQSAFAALRKLGWIE